MALPVNIQLRYWGIATAVFLGILWALGDVLMPFIVGGAIAYFLDPVADRLQRIGLNRTLATTLISLVFVLVVASALLVVVPMLAREAVALFQAMPALFQQLQTFLADRFPDIVESDSQIRKTLSDLGDTLRSRGGELVNGLLGRAMGVVNVVIFMVVVPVVAFYLLLDWDNLMSRVDALLPRDHAPVIRRLAGEIDAVLAGFVRGQLTVCGILAIYYAGALGLVGLQYGLVVGVAAGLISFIPYVGAVFGGVLSIGLALFQFWAEPQLIVAVIAIFVVGQILEGNVLVPKLVGGSVGLHPVWLLLALSVFGALFGFVGLLVAVPLAATLGVVARFFARQYQDSVLYSGLGNDDHDPPDEGASPPRRAERST